MIAHIIRNRLLHQLSSSKVDERAAAGHCQQDRRVGAQLQDDGERQQVRRNANCIVKYVYLKNIKALLLAKHGLYGTVSPFVCVPSGSI